MPLFSVIITSLGRLELLQHSIASALKQDCTNFELIVVNSHPSSEADMLITLLTNKHIRYITTSPSEANLNWDVGLSAATGEYVLWLDDDNYLLPHALSTLSRIISDDRPDIATGDHIHWYEAHHPRQELRNRIAMPTFTHSVQKITGESYLQTLFGVSIESHTPRARFHFSETAIQRSYVEKIRGKIHHIDFHGTSPRMLQFILVAGAHTITYINSPLCIVMQMGDSLAYSWTSRTPQKQKTASAFTHSPVKRDTYSNEVTECLLATKHQFSDFFESYSLNWDTFFQRYSRELPYLDQEWIEIGRSWIELRNAMSSRGIPVKNAESIARLFKAYGIKVMRITHTYPFIAAILHTPKGAPKNSTLLLNDSIHTIADCAHALPHTIESSLKIPYDQFTGVQHTSHET